MTKPTSDKQVAESSVNDVEWQPFQGFSPRVLMNLVFRL
jgi:hypothetical protein